MNYSLNKFGAKGDGINDDTDYINKILSNNSISINLYQNKVYGISNSLTINDGRNYNFNNATIKALNSNAKIFITGNINDTPKLDNLNFDGNFIADIGVETTDCRYLRLNNAKIKNICKYGVYVYKNTETGKGALFANNINIMNNFDSNLHFNMCKNAIALKINSTDCQIVNGTTTNFITHIECSNDTLIENIHAWNYYNENYDITLNSCFIKTQNSVRIINCFIDSIMTMLDMENADSIYTASFIDNSIFFYNLNQITDLAYTPKPIIKNDKCFLYCYNSKFNITFNKDKTSVNICNTNINFWSNGIYTIKTNLITTNLKSSVVNIANGETYTFEPFTNFALIIGGVGQTNDKYLAYVGKINPSTSLQEFSTSEKYSVSCDNSRQITISSTREQTTVFTVIHD